MAVLTPSLRLAPTTSQFSNRRYPRHSIAFNVRNSVSAYSGKRKLVNLPLFFKSSTTRIRNFQQEDAGTYEAVRSIDTAEGQDKVADQGLSNQETRTTGTGSSFLPKFAIALGIAATITLISLGFKRPMNGSSPGVHYLTDGSSASILAAPSIGFTFKVFGYTVVLPAYAPGWIYFWLLMAAGWGLFISEEALNIWVCPLYRLASPWHGRCLWMEHGSLLLNHSPGMLHT